MEFVKNQNSFDVMLNKTKKFAILKVLQSSNSKNIFLSV